MAGGGFGRRAIEPIAAKKRFAVSHRPPASTRDRAPFPAPHPPTLQRRRRDTTTNPSPRPWVDPRRRRVRVSPAPGACVSAPKLMALSRSCRGSCKAISRISSYGELVRKPVWRETKFGGVLSVKAGLGKKETTRPVDFITVCPYDARSGKRRDSREACCHEALPNVSNTVS